MARVVHFELPADNPERAVEFYTKAFGWKIQKWAGPTDYWLVSTGDASEPGINGGIMKRLYPGFSTVNTIGVANVDQAVAAVEAAGGKVVAPKMAVPGIGWLAYCLDSEGNQFGMMQNDPSAK